MKTIKDVTQEDLNLMAKHHRMYKYTPEELGELSQLIRDWVNPNFNGCTSCSNNLREYKDQLNSLYVAHKVTMQQIIDERNKVIEQEVKSVIEESGEVKPEIINNIKNKRKK